MKKLSNLKKFNRQNYESIVGGDRKAYFYTNSFDNGGNAIDSDLSDEIIICLPDEDWSGSTSGN